jgi:DNA polymerase-1
MIWCILDMSRVCIDVDGWLKLAVFHAAEGSRLEKLLGFNVFSHEIVRAAVEKEVGFAIANTNGKETLEPLARTLGRAGRTAEKKFVKSILLARQYRKAAETYGQSWVDQHVEPGGFVYPDWKNNGTETARMTCANPNLQNIPTRDLPVFRSLFISRHGKTGRLLIADQEQQEVRILAHLSGDQQMRADILADKDLHAQAAKDFGLADRDEGKETNFALSYGQSAWGLARRTGISEEQAQIGIKKRNRRYPAVVEWSQKQIASARALDYVKSTMGRRVWVNRYALYGGADRNAINSPVQTTASEQTKLWQNLIHAWCREEGYDYSVGLAIHDEIVVDIPQDVLPPWRKAVKESGIESGRITVPGFPMKTKVSVGLNWGDKKK